MSRSSLPLVTGVALAGLLASACGSGGGAGTQPSAPLEIVVTTTVLGEIVAGIVGGDGQVEVLMEPGQDPHGFALSARQAASLREADLVIANGLGLEASVVDAFDAVEQDGTPVLRVAEQLDPLPYAGDHGDEQTDHGDQHDEHGDDHAGADPHVWYDPVRMARAAEVIASRLAEVDASLPDETWQERGRQAADALRAADGEVRSILSAVPERCRVMVTNHDSFGYFAARYQFTIIATIVPGTAGQAEPSAREFAELVTTVRDSGMPAIFAETSQSSRLAETLASEVGRDVQVVTLFTDSLGPEGSGAETYVGMMTTNARRIADALERC